METETHKAERTRVGIVACMDWRENRKIEEYFADPNYDMHVFRTAGGRVTRQMLNEIRALNLSRLDWLPHTDCGALNVAFGELSKANVWPGAKPADVHEVVDHIANIIKTEARDPSKNYRDRNIFDLSFYTQGSNILRAKLPGVEDFNPHMVDVSGIVSSRGAEKFLLVAEDITIPPSTLIKYAESVLRISRGSGFSIDEHMAYIIQAPEAKLTEKDKEVAESKLGIKDTVAIPRGAIPSESLAKDLMEIRRSGAVERVLKREIHGGRMKI